MRRWLLPGLVAGLLWIGVAATWLEPESGEHFGFFGLVGGLAVAVVLIHRRSKPLSTKERRAWRLVAVALGLFGAGVLVIGILTGLGVALPAFGPLDTTFLAAYVVMIVALYRLARLDSGGQEWVLTALDAMVGGVALAALGWTFVFNDLIDVMAEARWWEVAIAVSYPLADMVMIVALLILVLRRSNYHLDLRLMFFAAGAGAQVLADFIFLRRGVGGDFTTAEPAWAMNLTATALLVLMAAIVDKTPKQREFPESPTPIWALMWPYLLAASLLVVHFQKYRELGPDSSEVLVLDGVILIGVLIFLRQVYVIYRDRSRVDAKRAELVASVSHELRTPLTAMVGFLTLLDEHADEFPRDAQEEMISEAAHQAEHMSRLVSDLLMLARGDTTTMEIEMNDVSVVSIVTSVLRTTDPGNTRIEEDLQASVIVRVDPDRMKQALANLVSNAVRYGGKRCLIVAKTSGRDLTFEVHDDGEGVPTRYESIIWHHFERGAHRLDAVIPGLGIGLSIVQAVAETHGGRADYRQSERLGGACFSMTIPDCVLADEPTRDRLSAVT